MKAFSGQCLNYKFLNLFFCFFFCSSFFYGRTENIYSSQDHHRTNKNIIFIFVFAKIFWLYGMSGWLFFWKNVIWIVELLNKDFCIGWLLSIWRLIRQIWLKIWKCFSRYCWLLVLVLFFSFFNFHIFWFVMIGNVYRTNHSFSFNM